MTKIVAGSYFTLNIAYILSFPSEFCYAAYRFCREQFRRIPTTRLFLSYPVIVRAHLTKPYIHPPTPTQPTKSTRRYI